MFLLQGEAIGLEKSKHYLSTWWCKLRHVCK